MKILVGGGAGYIGSALIPELLNKGYDVDVIDLLWFGNNIAKNVKVTQKNLFNCTTADFKGYDQFIFLAGLSNDPMAEYSPSLNFIYNSALPSFLAYKAKIAGIKRFIYASSCSVYGNTSNELFDENSPTISNYPYGISKLQGEKGVLQLQDENFSVIVLRQGTLSGFSPRMRMDLAVNTMFMSAMTRNEIVINNPSIWRPILDLRDAVNAYISAIKAHSSINGIFNVASGNYTVENIACSVKDELEELTSEQISLDIRNIEDFRNYRVKLDKINNILGFSPKFSLKDITVDLFSHKKLFGDYNQDAFSNIKTFKKLHLEHNNVYAG